MVEAQSETLDKVFAALGHPIRRQILLRLAQGKATVTDIAEPFAPSLNAISKHLKVLEKAGLIEREIIGREHYCSINPRPLEEVSDWLGHYQAFWTSRLEALEQELVARRPSRVTEKEQGDSTRGF
ncbi:MAG TPA: metalloregulator ArsR/SmtB family transcription factor [Anaerolineae bacterium]